jgi:beta-phosphoglucomutase-like phosphatase (HAD superfamily)
LRLLDEGAIHLRPGVERLLIEAHQTDLALAIATTTTRVNIDALLQRTLPDGALNWFAVIAAAEDAPRKKPDPSVYRFVLDRLGMAPGDCLAFEDSEAGLHAALAAGIPTVITLNDYTADQAFSGALAVLSDLGDPGVPACVVAGPPLERGWLDVAYARTISRRNDQETGAASSR